MTTKLFPTPGNLVVRRLEESEMTESGLLYIPATADRQHGAATVEILEINPPADEDLEDYFKIGQRVIIGKWQGTEVTVGQGKDRQTVIIINESAVLAVIKEEPDAASNT